MRKNANRYLSSLVSTAGQKGRGVVNGLWNSNLGGAALGAGVGLAEHEVLKNISPQVDQMSPIGHGSSQLLASILPMLVSTPLGRQLLMKGRAGSATNLRNATKPLLGPGRVSWADCSPRAAFGVTTPKAVLLSVLMGVLCCLWPISLRSWCIGTALQALIYSAPSSALAALDMMAFRILETLCMVPLLRGFSKSLE